MPAPVALSGPSAFFPAPPSRATVPRKQEHHPVPQPAVSLSPQNHRT
ncbi:hypothetical protein DESPIGER_0855 [Desulfovibrio piger]|uniref:Uncharacterized protein n=1 Tax=Desulfovibrio piger TaxID=901 RepID=A0A1K1LDF0_9BACT|nr:hypothetical protein DESPIGER_0855 [Desulfovibrio piger]